MRSTYTHLTEERTQRQSTATGTKSPEAVSRDKVTGGSQGTQNRHRRKPEATNDVEIYARSESRSSSRSIFSMAISSDSSEGDSGSSRGAQAIASEEIGVPRGKKSERYRSTPHYRSRSLVLALRKRLRKSGYREGRKASATAQPLTDRQTDDNLFRFRASVYLW